MQKPAKKAVVLLLCLTFLLAVFSGCGRTGNNQTGDGTTSRSGVSSEATSETVKENLDPLGKYEPGITLTAVRKFSAETPFPEGDDLNNNIWTRAWEEKLGIKIEYLWTIPAGEEYVTKLQLAIATDSLPDIIPFSNSTLYQIAAESGRLYEISEVFDKYAGDYLRNTWAKANNGIGMKMATVNGKLYGIPGVKDTSADPNFLFLRKDWLDKTSRQMPKTLAELKDVLIAFAKEDPDGDGKPNTYGLGFGKFILEGCSTALPIFEGYKSYPKLWVEKDGKLEYGGIQEETKAALQYMIDLYAVGALDPEFSVLDVWNDLPGKISKNTYGAYYGQNWTPGWPQPDSVKADPKAVWVCEQAPSVDGSPVMYGIDPKWPYFTGISAKCKNPEAVIKLLNLSYELGKRDPNNPEENKYRSYMSEDGKTKYEPLTSYYPDNNMPLVELYSSLDQWRDVKKIYDANGAEGVVGMDRYIIYKQCREHETATDPMVQYGTYNIFSPNGAMRLSAEAFDNNRYFFDNFFGPDTETMKTKKSELESKMNELFVKAIVNKDLKVFDEWLQYWKDNGGEQVTKEVNEWYASSK